MTAMMVHREKSFTEDIWKKEAMKLKAMAEIDKGIIRIAEKNAEKAWQDGFEAECKQANKSEIELQDKIGELEASSLTKDEARGIINGVFSTCECNDWFKKKLIKAVDDLFAGKGVDVSGNGTSEIDGNTAGSPKSGRIGADDNGRPSPSSNPSRRKKAKEGK